MRPLSVCARNFPPWRGSTALRVVDGDGCVLTATGAGSLQKKPARPKMQQLPGRRERGCVSSLGAAARCKSAAWPRRPSNAKGPAFRPFWPGPRDAQPASAQAGAAPPVPTEPAPAGEAPTDAGGAAPGRLRQLPCRSSNPAWSKGWPIPSTRMDRSRPSCRRAPCGLARSRHCAITSSKALAFSYFWNACSNARRASRLD